MCYDRRLPAGYQLYRLNDDETAVSKSLVAAEGFACLVKSSPGIGKELHCFDTTGVPSNATALAPLLDALPGSGDGCSGKTH